MKRFSIKILKLTLATLIFMSILVLNVSSAQAAYSVGTIVTLTNTNRTQNGLGELSTNSTLVASAYAKAKDIIENDYFAHNSPAGKSPWDFINEAGYNYAFAGENLAIGYADANELFNAWMNSQTHRDNILNSNFREIGAAVISGDYQGQETIVTVQHFGASASPEKIASDSSIPSPSPSAEQNAVNSDFKIIKADFSPPSIFAGEEATFQVQVSGELKSLELKVSDNSYNLLDTAAVTGSEEKTYTLRQKIDKEGDWPVQVAGIGKNGKTQEMTAGQLSVKAKVIAKESIEKPAATSSDWLSLFRSWTTYVLGLGAIILGVGIYFILHQRKKQMFASWRM